MNEALIIYITLMFLLPPIMLTFGMVINFVLGLYLDE